MRVNQRQNAQDNYFNPIQTMQNHPVITALALAGISCAVYEYLNYPTEEITEVSYQYLKESFEYAEKHYWGSIPEHKDIHQIIVGEDWTAQKYSFEPSKLGEVYKKLPYKDYFILLKEKYCLGVFYFNDTTHHLATSRVYSESDDYREECKNIGYKGRIGIFEVVRITAELRDLIQKRAPLPELQAVATSMGMMSITENGLEKVRDGTTSLEEVVTMGD